MSEIDIKFRNKIPGTLVLAIFFYILVRSCIEFYAVAWGTGVWLGEFSLKWGLGFFAFVLFCILTWVGSALVMWKSDVFGKVPVGIVSFCQKIKAFRWVIVFALLALPIWFLQYTPWGVVFRGLYFRLFLWGYVVFGLAIFLKSGNRLMSWSTLLSALLLTSSAYSLAFALINVTDYPFSQGWSEGNRMWDYSMMFGRYLYDYPADKEAFVLLDIGRQFIGGLPFIIPGISIQTERLWVGLTTVIPYLLLGFAIFRSDFKNKRLWFLLALWTFTFLKQGPIHPPLVMCAFVVALLWRGPLWLGIPLILATGYFAEESRFTWLFAPGIWIVMLEFSGAALENGILKSSTWWRSAVLGLSGAIGGYFGSSLLGWVKDIFDGGGGAGISLTEGAISVESVTSSASSQPLLWYRLLPNATHGMGIILALLIAVTPTILLLIYLLSSKKWIPNPWQKAGLLLPLLAFLAVGLIVSTKIGGGGDLHNLDMFLIGILFTAAIAWENGGRQWLGEIDSLPIWTKGLLILLMVIPGIYPLSALRSYSFTEDVPWLVTLTDVSDGKFLGMLPPQAEVDEIIQTIQREVANAKSNGEVLFMDQRQLLTFGYIEDVPLVPEYEKKVLMNEAMADEAQYFQELYADLAAKRFSLIITEPLRAPIQDSSYQFGEENNAWVKWIVEPVLCYYEPIETFKSVQIQLLVPNSGNVDCSAKLPVTLEPQE